MSPAYAKMPNALLLVACGPAEWRRLIKAGNEGGSPLWINWLRETYLSSLAWKRKQEERLALDSHQCACCGSTATRSTLAVYHKSEASFGDENVATDLETRCRSCHAEHLLEDRLDLAVDDASVLRSMKESLKLFTRDTEKRAINRTAIAMLG